VDFYTFTTNNQYSDSSPPSLQEKIKVIRAYIYQTKGTLVDITPGETQEELDKLEAAYQHAIQNIRF
jgi:hypothetical protein